MAFLERYCYVAADGGSATNAGSTPLTPVSGTGWTRDGGAGTMVLTLAGSPDLSGVSVNDRVYLASGTGGYGTTWFKITAVDDATDKITVHADPGAGNAAYAWTIGGPLLFENAVLSCAIGERWNLKSHATNAHLITADRTVAATGTAASPYRFQGYTTTIGDGGVATINWNYTSSGTSVITNAGYSEWVDVIVAPAASNACVRAMYGGTTSTYYHVKVTTPDLANDYAIHTGSNGLMINCWCDGAVAAGNYLVAIATRVCSAVSPALNTNFAGGAINCLVYRSGAAGGVGIALVAAAARPGPGVVHCTVYGFQDAISITADSGANLPALINNILYSHSRYGVAYAGAANLFLPPLINNAFGAISTAQTNGLADALNAGAITLSADPFVDGVNGDFRLNNAAGGGAACRGVGCPTDINHDATQDNWLDLGALQRFPDFPIVGNVTEDDTTDGATGSYHEATEAEVQSGVTFGAASALTGTYSGGGGGGGPIGNNMRGGFVN